LLPENGIIRVGAEIEVAQWADGARYQDVAANLVEAGFMEGTARHWDTYHDYNCRCEFGCERVASGAVLLPQPLVSMQYDASLPNTGAEFIISPVLLIDGMVEMRRIWEIITEKAVWAIGMADRRGRPASPSIHLHVSATRPGFDATRMRMRANGIRIDDALHGLSLFAPELLLLSDIEEFRRGILYRQPWRQADGNGRHHGFVHIRDIRPPDTAYIEWRMFEAAYNDWDYFESAAYLAAALTRALLRTDFPATLMRMGYEEPVPTTRIEQAINHDSTAEILDLVSRTRLRSLRQIVMAEMNDDALGLDRLTALFEGAERRV
jgi:hypothetical protein